MWRWRRGWSKEDDGCKDKVEEELEEGEKEDEWWNLSVTQILVD